MGAVVEPCAAAPWTTQTLAVAQPIEPMVR